MTSYQQSFEINTGMQSINVNFVGENKQFASLEVPLVYNKSDEHETIYDSYNFEFKATKIQLLKIENTSTTDVLSSEIKYDVDDADDAYWLYLQFAAFSCNGYSIVPLANFANNKTYQELVRQEKYLTSPGERLYIDLRRSKGYTDELGKLTRDDSGLKLTATLTDATTKKIRLRDSGYSQGEYYYVLSKSRLLMQYKNYGISKDKNIVA